MIKVRCPICGECIQGNDAARRPDFPFCSARCRLIDLGRWLGEKYAIRPKDEAEDPALTDNEYCIP
jgi:endogenous inhibitor of DNA gyrase (YacG/DUF329 family)